MSRKRSVENPEPPDARSRADGGAPADPPAPPADPPAPLVDPAGPLVDPAGPLADPAGPPAAPSPATGRPHNLTGLFKPRARAAGDWLQGHRRTNPVVDFALTLIERDRSMGGVVLAGAVAFRLFTFFVPFIAFILVALGTESHVKRSERDLAERLGISGLVAKAAGNTSHFSAWERLTTLIVLAITVWWAARVLYRVLHVVFSLEWSLPVVRVKATKPALGVIVFVTVCLLAEIGLSRLRAISPIGGVVGGGLFILVPTLYWVFMLQVLPHDVRCRWWRQVPGALLIAIGIAVINLVTIYWVARQVADQSSAYGGVGSALAILFWAYLIGRLVVIGAIVNALLWQRSPDSQEPAPTPAPAPGGSAAGAPIASGVPSSRVPGQEQ